MDRFLRVFSPRVFIVSNFRRDRWDGFLIFGGESTFVVRVAFETFVRTFCCLVGENPPSDAESTRFHELDILFRFNFMDSSSCTSSPSKSSLA